MSRITWTDQVAAVAVALPYSDISLASLSGEELGRLRALIVDLQADAAYMTPNLGSRFERLLPMVDHELERLSA